jgi:DNA-binding transcriptional regulator YiaG
MRARIEVPRFVPAALERARRKAGLTRQQLGERLQLSRHAVWTWETGQAPIPARALRIAAPVLGCTPAQLQRPPKGPPTLADLRMRLALTVDELAERTHLRVHRLELWEATGRLGKPEEESNPICLASLLGTYAESIEAYLQSGRMPDGLARQLAAGLQVPVEVVQSAFAASRGVRTLKSGSRKERRRPARRGPAVSQPPRQHDCTNARTPQRHQPRAS